MQAAEEHLPISEIFYSVQGEGVHSGTPSVFLRTYRCNLSCTWCDSKYTWQDQDKAKEGVDYTSMPTAEVLERIASYGCRHLVVTGGEPLLHQRLLAPLLAGLKRLGFFVEVETNGTVALSTEIEASVDCFNVSPKISNSLVEEVVRIRPESLKAFVRSRKAWFKFVVCGQKDLDEIEGILSEFGVPRDRVLLMPEGIDAETILTRSRWLTEVCKKSGLRFSPRLHILLYGNKRGV
ncbi:MAG TPA: 7-carboxy-7-deazaguanine synthase QueE [Nitrososphaerales archaeon]|nr:7-carboxy-7-deazaguanine synthase QueE [Nitrososphaerales archaeon]